MHFNACINSVELQERPDQAMIECTNPADGHLVGGERAGLVGADDGRAAERLHRRQAAHDRVLLGHATCACSVTSA